MPDSRWLICNLNAGNIVDLYMHFTVSYADLSSFLLKFAYWIKKTAIVNGGVNDGVLVLIVPMGVLEMAE